MKFLGACNAEKVRVDKCFRAEKEYYRSINLYHARECEKQLQEKNRKQ